MAAPGGARIARRRPPGGHVPLGGPAPDGGGVRALRDLQLRQAGPPVPAQHEVLDLTALRRLRPRAHSDFGDVRYAWVRDLEAFCRGVETGESVLAESERIPPRDRDTEYLMLGLRTARGIGRQEFESRFRLPFAPIAAALEPLPGPGLGGGGGRPVAPDRRGLPPVQPDHPLGPGGPGAGEGAAAAGRPKPRLPGDG